MVSYLGQRWIVVVERRVEKELYALPREVRKIMDLLRQDMENEGPVPRGWVVKHVKGRPGVYSVRLKREYRVLYEIEPPRIIVFSVAHRREAY